MTLGLFIGILILMWFFFHPRSIGRFLLFIGTAIIVLILIALGTSSYNNYITTTTPKPTEIPIPTQNPNATWHTIYTFSGGNGQTETDDFTIKGKKWKLDYQTFNQYGYLDINGVGNGNIGDISIDGIANNSMPGYNACWPNLCPPDDKEQYSLSVDSYQENYSLQVEDYY